MKICDMCNGKGAESIGDVIAERGYSNYKLATADREMCIYCLFFLGEVVDKYLKEGRKAFPQIKEIEGATKPISMD